jgi:hypothetical protein
MHPVWGAILFSITYDFSDASFVRMPDARESDRAVSVSNALSRREYRFRDRKGHGDEPDASRAVCEQGPTPRCCSGF